MKQKSVLTRCLALALALLLAVSSANLGLVSQVFAADVETVALGELIANNYELTEAEENLLNSGLLTGTIDYVPFDGEGLVSVDTDEAVKSITAKAYEGWVPTYAEILVGTDVKETVTLTNGKGNYAYDENAFSVKVYYKLEVEVDEALQGTLLSAADDLRTALADMGSIGSNDTEADLETIVAAMPALLQLAEGVSFEVNGVPMLGPYGFGDDAKVAVEALNAQLKANLETTGNELLNLQIENANCDSSSSMSKYLVECGNSYQSEAISTYNYLKDINDDGIIGNPQVQDIMKSKGYTTEWKMLENAVKDLVVALEPGASWNTTAIRDGLTDAEYKKLDNLVAVVGSVTEVAITNPLLIGVDSVQENLSMNDVTVNVVLKVVTDKDDSEELVEKINETYTITLATGTEPAAIIAEIETAGFEAEALAGFADIAYYDSVRTELTENLTEDIAYTITYTPKEYTVDCEWLDADADPKVPYGYRMTLENAGTGKAYDYIVNGEPMAQGEVYTVVGNTTISREEGREYSTKQLYALIADNFGNTTTDAILKSGALHGDEAIYYRKPTQEDVDNEQNPLITLSDDVLTAKNYDASCEGNVWVPYTYGEEGTENTFTGNTAAWEAMSVGVQYKLELKHIDSQEVIAALELARTLRSEAASQKSALDELLGKKDELAQLDKTKLGALNGVIDVTDMTPGDDTDEDAKNLELRAYFKGIVSALIDNALDGSTLKIVKILADYESQGLQYYYTNSTSVIAEIDRLSGYLSEMVADEEKTAALEVLTEAAGYSEYAEKIMNIEVAMARVQQNLIAPNEMIDVTSKQLGTLVTALLADGEPATEPDVNATYVPYVTSETLKKAAETVYFVTVNISANGKTASLYSNEVEDGTGETVDLAALQAKVEAEVAKMINGDSGVNKVPYYTLTADTKLESINPALTARITVNYTYTPTDYIVIANGVEGTINVNNLTTTLPGTDDSNLEYTYYIDGLEKQPGPVTFTLDQIDRLFVNGKYTVDPVIVNKTNQKLLDLVDALGENFTLSEDFKVLTGNIPANAGIAETLAMAFVNSGYTYVGLNENGLMYMNEENTLELSIQALINALLEDTTFSNQTIIDLRDNNGGKLLKTTLKLGNTKDDLDFDNIEFILNLNGVPSQMVTVANGLDAVKNYMTFKSDGEHMDVILNLPEKVYEAYLTAMLATGTVDKSDANAIDHIIAYEFFEDYLNTVVENDNITATTFENTLNKMDKAVNDKTDYDLPNYDLSAYDNYYQAFKNALKQNVTITANADDLTFDFAANGQTGIDALVKLLGVDISSFGTYLGMVKEYKDGAEPVVAQVVATLTNLHEENNFEAAMVDIRNDAMKNKLDYTTDLEARVDEITGGAIIVLLDDIGSAADPVALTFDATTVIDLNGKTIYGSIVANGKVLIMDSNLDNKKAGTVTGTLRGDVNLVAGNFAGRDVSEFVNNGYEQNADGLVQNVLYTLETNETGKLIVNIDSDVLNEEIDSYTAFAASVAADLAVDLVANYYTSAALYVGDNHEGDYNKIYDIDFNDLIDLIDSDSIPTDVLNEALTVISLPDLADFINEVIEDLLDFESIEAAIRDGEAIASYKLQTQPWRVNLEYVADGDYLTCGIVANEDNAENITLNLTMAGAYTKEAADMVEFLNEIVLDGTKLELVNVEELTYSDKHFNLTGGVEGKLIMDLSDYTTYMAIVLANGAEGAKKDALVNAVNADDQVALKAAFDALSVKDVFTALKVLKRGDDFATLAANVGMNVNINLEDKKEVVEKVLITGLAAAGRALEELEITGRESTLGNLDKDGDGWYKLSAARDKDGTVTRRGYGVKYDVTTVYGELEVNLFALTEEEDCLWGDANHDGIVDNRDAMLVLRYDLNKEISGYFCTAKTDVNGDGYIDNRDAMLILQYDLGKISKFPAEE